MMRVVMIIIILSDYDSSLSCRNQTEGFFKATDSDYAQNKW